MRITPEALTAAVLDVLEAAGVPCPIRDIEAEIAVEADVMGVPSHGVRMLPALVNGIRRGEVNPVPRLPLLRERGAVCVMDGERGPGRYASLQAMRHAMQRADEFGVGACLAANMTHWGRAHAYAYRAAQEGMIGICMTNATPNMLAPGASRPILANNPMAIGVPRGPDQDPVVFDFAMSQAAVGKVDTCRREGQNAPLGWGLDASGQPTSDPGAILASGNILPTGGHKGAGLAIMIELLTGALAGGAFSFEAIQLDAGGTERHSSKLFLALNIDALGERATFQERVAALIDYLRDSADPGQEVLYPGERGYRARDRHLAEGIPLEPQTVAELRTIGMKLDERG